MEVNDLIKIVDMYLDEEQTHYQENPTKDHIFHSLLNVSLWIKEHHTMLDKKYKENIDD